MENKIFEKVDNYISNLFAQDDKALSDSIKALEIQNITNISITATQGKLLQVIATLCNAKKILELGTLAGYSTIWLARTLPENGKLITIEFDADHAKMARMNIDNAGLLTKVEIRVGNALDILPKLEQEKQGPFDMIFIDADKEPYAEYLHWALRLSRPGTVIVADNVIRNGAILDTNSNDKDVQGVQRFNKMLAECSNVTAIILQTVGIKEYDGIAIAVVKN
jgi:caffeoyl-CoA O-methyltransferase